MVFLWSANFVVGKMALRELPPLLLGGFRTVLAGILLWVLYVWNNRRNGDVGCNREDLPVLISLGVVGAAVNPLCFVLGLNRTSVAHSSIVLALTPILVLLI